MELGIKIRCPLCFNEGLLDGFVPNSAIAVIRDAISCSNCGAAFPALHGTPMLAGYGKSDVVRLVETLAHSEIARTRMMGIADGSHRVTVSPDALYEALRRTESGEDEDTVFREMGFDARPWWWENRKAEFRTFQWVTAGLDFGGKIVVDVGAGSGTDAMLYVKKGAKVVAVEPDFVTLSEGLRRCPELHWIGGVAEVLPLASKSADFVVANASLHHHESVAASLREMLRVVKTGGMILTMGDPFKAGRSMPIDDDTRQFDSHAYVLRGINEQILRLETILDALGEHSGELEIAVLLELPEACRKVEFTFEEAVEFVQTHPKAWGSVALAIKKVRDTGDVAGRFAEGTQMAGILMDEVIAGGSGFGAMAQILAGHHFAQDFLSDGTDDRWLQINGWRLMQAAHPDLRLAYERARLFFPACEGPKGGFGLEWMVPDCAASRQATVAFQLNGRSLHRAVVRRGVWHRWEVPVPDFFDGVELFCAQLCLEGESWSEGLNLRPENHIAITDFKPVGEVGPGAKEWLSDEPCLEALLNDASLTGGFDISCGEDTDAAMGALQALRELTGPLRLRVIVHPRQVRLFSSVPWLDPLSSAALMPESLRSWSRSQPLLAVGFSKPHFTQSPSWEPENWGHSWWLDAEGRPVRLSALGRPVLRESLLALDRDPAVVRSLALAEQLDRAETKVQELRNSRDKLRSQLEKERARSNRPARTGAENRWYAGIARVFFRRPPDA